MTSPWWSKQPQSELQPDVDTEPAPGPPQKAPVRSRPIQPTAAPAPSSGDSDSIGEQIDHAMGDFANRLTQLREALVTHKSDIIEIETEIEKVEKDQAKAFKSLLSENPTIKKMLGANRRRNTRRQKSRRKTDTDSER